MGGKFFSVEFQWTFCDIYKRCSVGANVILRGVRATTVAMGKH
jgi:hypothetical protein